VSPALTYFGATFSYLAPLGGYVERAGLIGDVHPEIGPSLSRFLNEVNTASSAIFRHLVPDIRSSLDSLDPAIRLGGLRRFQLALQFEGRDSEVVGEITRELEEPDRVVLRDELEKESARLGDALKRHDKGLLGRIAVRLPMLEDPSDLLFGCSVSLEDLCRAGNLQAARRLFQLGRLDDALERTDYFKPLYPEMMTWFSVAEFFSHSPASSFKFKKGVFYDLSLIVDGFFMSALQLHRGGHLLDLHEGLAFNRLQTWIGHWVDALNTFSRRIDLHEGRRFAKDRPDCFTAAAVGTLLEIADGRFPEETAAETNPTERAEAAEEARFILRTLANMRPGLVASLNTRAGPWWARRSPPATSPSPAPVRPSPLTVSLTAPIPDVDPSRLGEHSIFLIIGRSGQKSIPLPLVDDQELVISVDASDPTAPSLRLKYRSDLFQIVDIMEGIHLEEGRDKRPLKKNDWLNFGARFSIAGYIVHIVKPARPIELE